MSSPFAGPSNAPPSPRSISGTTPGILDPSQVNRLLRLPTSKLSFAFFDPRTAHVNGTESLPDLSRLCLDEQNEHCRPKRIVIETTPQGASFWRFVPRARMGEGVTVYDEGIWPKIVEICGEKVHCTQDQWDIYKLDPAYDCVVQLPPNLFIISRTKPMESATPVPPSTPSSRKRRPPSPHLNIPPQSSRKRSRTHSPSSLSTSSSEENMSVDDAPRFRSQTAALGYRARKLREQNEKARKARREKIMRFQAKQNHQEDENMFSPTEDTPSTPRPRFQSMPGQSPGKRKMPGLDPSLRQVHNQSHPDIQEEDGDDSFLREPGCRAPKRMRTTSPERTRTTTSKRADREKEKQQRWRKIIQDRKLHRDQRFMDDMLTDIPESVFPENGETTGSSQNTAASDEIPQDSPGEDGNSNDAPQEFEQPVDEETARRSALAESIRKLRDLEKDRPLWDEAAKKRIQRETAEEDERRAKAEERRRAAAWKAEQEMRAKTKEEEMEARARAETERRKREAAAAAKYAKQKRQRWESGHWTTSRALDRYKALCDSFDNAKFSHTEPLTFEDVPWPVLAQSFSVEDVDWAAVERFFEAIKPYIRSDEYSGFVEKSHRRFHPDRWKSRRLLTSVVDQGDRECMEVAANTVAQALTPLWRNLREQ